MDKRYQVFISSTFCDLLDERQAVLKAVLELDHMPAGMELFPASDDSAWQLIKDVIDSSDYYVLIIGGRYGSLDDTGIGYTEKEYDYATSSKKPVVPLLHINPDNLPRDKTDTNEASWAKLKLFREKVEKRHSCVYWNSSEELKSKVIIGLTSTVKRHPAVGWVRADKVPSDTTVSEVLMLRRKVSELEAQISAERMAPPVGSEDLKQGNDEYQVDTAFKVHRRGEFSRSDDLEYKASFTITWNDIFAGIAPTLINEASEDEVIDSFYRYLSSRAREIFRDNKNIKGMELYDFTFNSEQLETCIIQLRALGLIRESQRQRSVKDTNTYWAITPYGDHLMVQLRALRRSSAVAVKANTTNQQSTHKKKAKS
ncbi:MAG: DUF4062 domain-containing protein [Thermodesulfobacteriota bacterium]